MKIDKELVNDARRYTSFECLFIFYWYLWLNHKPNMVRALMCLEFILN
uniref:NADH-plastoquinone oxidoreductase subunit 4L n=1 Tax=Pinguicula jackii TaxID=326271 RepID=A0A9E7V7X8_9LAMI|nr:NADH-plastoquinone oxidoreductase subunit 4L [Pinguicula jackii]UZA66306.1 NADH-plastoquinone oxidoreductase subunit 4L [Pinguicula jackii]